MFKMAAGFVRIEERWLSRPNEWHAVNLVDEFGEPNPPAPLHRLQCGRCVGSSRTICSAYPVSGGAQR
jgi:hypothetical protein